MNRSLRGFSAGELYDLINIFQMSFQMPRGRETAGAAEVEAESLSRQGSGLETGDQRDSSEDAERSTA